MSIDSDSSVSFLFLVRYKKRRVQVSMARSWCSQQQQKQQKEDIHDSLLSRLSYQINLHVFQGIKQ